MSEREPVLIIAHRGASADCPENTREAFLEAALQGADMVELDVRHTSDGDLIVNHDAWYRDGRSVWSTPSLQRPSDVLDLQGALDACLEGADRRGVAMSVNVEIKNSPGDLGDDDSAYSLETADKVVAALEARAGRGVEEQIVISSFDPPTVDRVRAVGGPPTAQLVLDPGAWPDVIASTAERGHLYIHPWAPFVDAALVAEAHRSGIGVNTWTVDEPDRIAELAAMGVDGVVTNAPAVARRAAH